MTDRSSPSLTGVVLAGGRARRMGGRDKGLIPLAGEPLAARAARLLGPQVDALLINANRNRDEYAALLPGVRVVGDATGGFLGPLAGMLAALEATRTDYVLTVPCDSPLLRGDYAERMVAALVAADARLAVAHDGERLQPVFALLQRDLSPDLRRALGAGERKIDRWYARHRPALADFGDAPAMFRNVNTPEELQALETGLRSGQAE
ncbi:MAG: molybdenum cofactor guanylyltransferase MobA [Candidatus Competibacterales bacterium]|nr:molybdenum cofactor guanylyltransferase MobA [Candidatus Competibacterales bacterium]